MELKAYEYEEKNFKDCFSNRLFNIWCIQAVKSNAGISKINFTPLTHPLPLPICSPKAGPERATGNQAKTIEERCILILATQLLLGSLNTLPSKCFHTPSYPSTLDRLSLNCKLIPQLIPDWHCYSNQTKLVKCPVGANWVLIQVPSAMWLEMMNYSLQVIWAGTRSQIRIKNNLFFSYPLPLRINTHSIKPPNYLLKSCL